MTTYLTNTLKQAVRSGRTAIGTGSHKASDTATFRTVAAAGADHVFIDLAHALMSVETTATLIWHCHGAGIAPLVRVSPGRPRLRNYRQRHRHLSRPVRCR